MPTQTFPSGTSCRWPRPEPCLSWSQMDSSQRISDSEVEHRTECCNRIERTSTTQRSAPSDCQVCHWGARQPPVGLVKGHDSYLQTSSHFPFFLYLPLAEEAAGLSSHLWTGLSPCLQGEGCLLWEEEEDEGCLEEESCRYLWDFFGEFYLLLALMALRTMQGTNTGPRPLRDNPF